MRHINAAGHWCIVRLAFHAWRRGPGSCSYGPPPVSAPHKPSLTWQDYPAATSVFLLLFRGLFRGLCYTLMIMGKTVDATSGLWLVGKFLVVCY